MAELIYKLYCVADYLASAAADSELTPSMRKSAAVWYGRVYRVAERLDRLSVSLSNLSLSSHRRLKSKGRMLDEGGAVIPA